jgi:uncharacterized membrane-anchored protein
MFRRKRRSARALVGTARVDRRTKDLVRRLRPGEVAVIDHADLDRVSAEALVERAPAAVVNASPSISGRYPNAGPAVLARAGIPLVDRAGAGLLDRIHEGEEIRIEGAQIFRDGELVASGTRLESDELERLQLAASSSMASELERFVGNTMEYLRSEGDVILRGSGLPQTRTQFDGRHALVLVRGHDYKEDLRALRGYVREVRPVLVAVDGAADALLEEGLRPDLIIGDMDSVSAAALTCGAELVVHAYPDGRAPGMGRLRGLGLEALTFASAGTSEDIALLLAYERGADLIVAVGAHANLVEFLDKGRGGMASTFLVRLKVGPKLVDAKGVNRLYRTQVSRGLMLLLVGSALLAMVIATFISKPLRLYIDQTIEILKDALFRLRHLF